MPFAHLADCHIGAWRDPRMKELAIAAFERTIAEILEQRLDFVIIAGDLFNTSLPPLDQVKRAVTQLEKLKQAGIPVYAIAGSHDYSPSGKTMLDVLEEAKLLVNVMKGTAAEDGKLKLGFTEDKKTGIKLVGILGRTNGLDTQYYEDLDRDSLENEPGKKIFLFHASITELKPKSLEQMDSSPVSMMPRNFDYYAGGHVHITNDTNVDGYRNVVYPGPLFPASFSELEELEQGSYVLVNDDFEIERKQVKIKERVIFSIDADKKDVETVNQEIEQLKATDVKDKVVLIRARGELAEGRVSDLRFKELIKRCYEQEAYFVMKNTTKLSSKEFEEFVTSQHASTEEVETNVIKEHLGQHPINGLSLEEEAKLTKLLIDTLGGEQHEGEKKYEYEERVAKAAKGLLE